MELHKEDAGRYSAPDLPALDPRTVLYQLQVHVSIKICPKFLRTNANLERPLGGGG
jgi:hypothetical protein